MCIFSAEEPEHACMKAGDTELKRNSDSYNFSAGKVAFVHHSSPTLHQALTERTPIPYQMITITYP